MTTVIAEIIVLIITFIGTKKYINFVVPKKIVMSVFFGCVYIAIECIVIEKIIRSDFWVLLFSVLLSILGYALILVIFKNPLIISAKTKFKGYIAKNKLS